MYRRREATNSSGKTMYVPYIVGTATFIILAAMLVGVGIATPILAQQVGEKVAVQQQTNADVNIHLKFACVNLIFYIGCW